MEKILNTIIITAASLLASTLLIIGIRKIEIKKYKKYGLFVSTILIALSLGGCDLLRQGDKKPAVPIEANKPQKINELQDSNIKADRISWLNKTDEWKSFKAFWRQLDNIAPKNETDDNVNGMKPYYGDYWQAISFDKAKSLKAELETFSNAFSSKSLAQGEEILSNTEIALLVSICTARIDYMSSDFSSMTSRMIPSPAMTGREDSIKDLEKRIDLLVELRKNKTIKEEEFQQALAVVKEDVKTFSVLEAITKHYGYYYRSVDEKKVRPDINTAEQYIDDFEKHYAEYLKSKKDGNTGYEYQEDLDKKYEETKTAIKQIETVLPSLNEMINDLERYE